MSQEHVSQDPELNAIEAALGSLVPAKSRIDRDRVMFLAGQAVARRSSSGGRGWFAIAASLALVALVEAGMLARQPSREIIERVVVVPAPDTSRNSSIVKHVEDEPAAGLESRISGSDFALASSSHDRLAFQILRYGLDGLTALPTTSWDVAGPSPAPSHQLLQEELRKILDSGGPS